MLNLASYLDSTNLKPDAQWPDIEKLCQDAIDYQMAAVCIHPHWVARAREVLAGTQVQLATVVGFPLGANLIDTKIFEARRALEDGADEIDMVLNLAALAAGDYSLLEREVRSMVSLKLDYPLVLKVIVETALLNTRQLAEITQYLGDWGADYIKTSTGFAQRGVSLEDIEVIRANRNPALKIKASGGIRTLDFALQLIEAGANRIGTSQAMALMRELEGRRQG
ncbi:MAG TPA: deoxyribose-phosphate aldolase [Syntrophomonadaceae bacterium]|nr:deoxyribose-phosphate aldolase [Syntrophomonadaceae bacterium]HPU48764.1 deoxyribose-phosphate aldolase [Syntrophomonadaceae bacterium]